MRTAPQSIVAQQQRYALGARLWRWYCVFPHFAAMGLYITFLMLDPGPPRLYRRLGLLVLSAVLASMLFLNPWGRAARCRKASHLLGSKVVRYEVGDSVSDADLSEAAEQAARILLEPLPAVPLFGKRPGTSGS